MESCEAPKLLNWPIKHGHVRRRESRQIYEVSPGAKTLSDLGISRHQSSRWQQLVDIRPRDRCQQVTLRSFKECFE